MKQFIKIISEVSTLKEIDLQAPIEYDYFRQMIETGIENVYSMKMMVVQTGSQMEFSLLKKLLSKSKLKEIEINYDENAIKED